MAKHQSVKKYPGKWKLDCQKLLQISDRSRRENKGLILVLPTNYHRRNKIGETSLCEKFDEVTSEHRIQTISKHAFII